MKIILTGCAGLLGANYSRHLSKCGHTVLGIDNLSGGYKAFVPWAMKQPNRKVKKMDYEITKDI